MTQKILWQTLKMRYILILFVLWLLLIPVLQTVSLVENSINPVWLKAARIYLWETRGHTVRSVQELDRWEQERLLYDLQRDVPYYEDREAQPISYFYRRYINPYGIPFSLGLLFLLIARELCLPLETKRG